MNCIAGKERVVIDVNLNKRGVGLHRQLYRGVDKAESQ